MIGKVFDAIACGVGVMVLMGVITIPLGWMGAATHVIRARRDGGRR